MGKGNRNRMNHIQESVEKPRNHQETKKTSDWVTRVISIVLLVGVLVGLGAWFISDNGIIERNRILVKSKSGKYHLTQQMATYMVWQSEFWNNYNSAQSQASLSASSTTQSESELVMSAMEGAKKAVLTQLNSFLTSNKTALIYYVSLCDKAREEGFKLTDADHEDIKDQMELLWTIKDNTGYYAVSKNKFLSTVMARGMKKKDIKAALELMTLADNFRMEYQARVAAGLEKDPEIESILESYREENPESFYSTSYVSYQAATEALAKLLTAEGINSAETFRETVLKYGFDQEYKTLFNLYTVANVGEAAEDYGKINGGQTDNENGNAWTEAIGTISGWEQKTYKNEDSFELPAEVRDWMFLNTREDFHANIITTLGEDGTVGVYLVAIDKVDDLEKSVTAHVKSYATSDGKSYDGKENFDALVFEYVKNQILKTELSEDYKNQTENYKSAKELATALNDRLTAEGADVAAILAEVTWENEITAESSDADKNKVHSTITKKLSSLTTVGPVVVERDFDTSYLVYVSEVDGAPTAYRYVSFESSPFNQIGDELVTLLQKNFVATEATIAYTKNDGNDQLTFSEWASETAENSGLSFVRKAGDTKYFAETKQGATATDAPTTVYVAYMITKEMAFDATTEVVRGGYKAFATEAEANEFVSQLSGKTGIDLIFALYKEGGTTSFGQNLDFSTLDKTVKSWFESTDRQANALAVVKGTDGGFYVTAFVDKVPAWKADARNGYVAQASTDWRDEISADYTVNEKALSKLPGKAEETTT